MKRYLFLAVIFLGLGAPLQAIDGLYLGGQLGHVALTGATRDLGYANALGFSVDLGLRANPSLDVMFRFGYSAHSGLGGLTLYHPTVSADFHFYEMNDFDLSLGMGPGFYFFKQAAGEESKFGLNFGANADVVVDESLRLGIGWRWHNVFGGSAGANFWSIMMRAGVFFDI